MQRDTQIFVTWRTLVTSHPLSAGIFSFSECRHLTVAAQSHKSPSATPSQPTADHVPSMVSRVGGKHSTPLTIFYLQNWRFHGLSQKKPKVKPRAGLSLTSPRCVLCTQPSGTLCPAPSFPRTWDISGGAVSIQEDSVIDLNKSRVLSTLGVLLLLLLCAPARGPAVQSLKAQYSDLYTLNTS